ncbi:MAG: RidA family protein [Spirochaetaceae bacterium]|nr:RidA family protein [Spirochaetaceae bacterium]
MKKKIETAKAPGAIGPYSQATQVGNTVFVSGQLPVDPASGELVTEIKAAATQSLSNMKAILEEAGYTMDDVTKTTVLLANIVDFAAVNEVYSQFFAAPYPARSCFAVKDLPKGALVEIECIAAK